MSALRGLASLVHDGVDAVVDLVEQGHDSAARAVLAVARRTPLAAEVEAVDAARAVITGLSLGSVRAVNAAVRAVTEAIIPEVEAAPVALRSDVVGTAGWVADAGLGLINGAVGDHLRRQGNGLDLGLRLRLGDVWLPVDPAGLAAAARASGAPRRVAVLVHGLMATEWSWWLDAERLHGDAADGLPTRLSAAGWTVVLVRYNSGVPVQDNGRRLASQLDTLLGAWPEAEVALVGHSMGGLVLRAAVAAGEGWRGRVSRAVCLGSPHEGAPLARGAAVVADALGAVDLPATQVIAGVLRGRSVGIRDLQRGSDEALADGVRWVFLSGGLSSSPGGLWTRALGDLLVPVDSAAAAALRPLAHAHLPGVPHHALSAHPSAVEAVLAALG